MPMMRKKQRRYGGADRPFDVRVVYVPNSEMMVGRNNGSEAKETLVLKFDIPNIQSGEKGSVTEFLFTISSEFRIAHAPFAMTHFYSP